jgi:galactoside O-acetyltransferase
MEFKGDARIGTIILKKHCIVGSGSVVTPDVVFEEGACLGALSLANRSLQEYTLYGGIPARILKPRDKEKIINLEHRFKHGE